MELTRENVAALIGAVVAVLLQIMVAPAIALFSAIPNFIVAFCVVRAVAAPYQAGSLIPLALGLVFDLVGGGPVGGMAFVLVLVTFFASRLFAALNNDTLFMPVTIILVSTMLVEVLYGLVVVACGAGVSLIESLERRSCTGCCPACSMIASSACCCIRLRFACSWRSPWGSRELRSCAREEV